MSCNEMAILFREADCHARPTVSCGLNRDSAALVSFTLMLYVFSTFVKAFVVDSRFVFKSRLKQNVHIMAFALLFCAITLPIQCTTHWSPFQGCVQCTWHSVILHLFYFWPKLHCILRLTLNYLGFLYYIRFAIAPSFRWLLFMQVLLSTAILFRSVRQHCLAAEEKTAFVTLMVPHTA